MGVVSTGSITLYDYNDQKSVNILDSSTWTVGRSGSQPGFNARGTAPATENSIVLGIDQLGRSNPLWKCVANTATPDADDGGWETDYFGVSDTKTYRFVVYLKRDTIDGYNVFGLRSNGSCDAVSLNGNDVTFPYFFNGDPPQTGRWYVLIGYVHPWNTSITTSIGGVYDMVTGQKVVNGTDFKWKQGTTEALHRIYYAHCATSGSTCYICGPRVEVCDGSEMPLEQLLAASASDYQLTQMASDGIITPQEKTSFLARWCEIINDTACTAALPTGDTATVGDGEFKRLRAQAVACSRWTPTLTGSSAKAYYDACEALRAYLFTTPGVLLAANWNNNITIDKTTFIGLWTAQVGAAVDLEKDIIASQVKYQYSVDGSTNWHTVWTAGDLYMRTSTDNGTTWSAAIRIVGEQGQQGIFTDFRFAKNTSSSSAPGYTANADNPGSNWYDAPQTLGTGEYQWMIQSDWRASTRLTNWTAPVRLSGEQGPIGPSGINGRVVNLTAGVLAFTYNSAGSSPTPANTTVTANTANTQGTVYYNFIVNGSSVQNTTASTLAYTPPASMTSMPQTITVEIREGASTGTVLAWDQLTMVGVKPGSSGITSVLPNGSVSLPADSNGVVSSYTGSGTTIQIYEGSTLLQYNTVLAAGKFTIGTPVVSPSGKIIVGAISGSGTTTATVAAHSAMDSATDSVQITYPITVQRADGSTVSLSLTQMITKSKQGIQGPQGVDAPKCLGLFAYASIGS